MSHLRMGLALCGFVLAVLGVAMDDVRLVWGAIAVLLASLILRLVLRKGVDGNSTSGG